MNEGEGESKRHRERDKVREIVEIEIGVGESAHHHEEEWRSKKGGLGWTTSLKVLVVLSPSLSYFFFLNTLHIQTNFPL